MGDYRDELRREVERHRLPDGTFERVSKRRDRRRRNRQVGTVLVAVAIAAAGSFGLFRVLGDTEEPAGPPTATPTVGATPSAPHPSPPVSPTSSPSPSPAAGALAPAVSGPIEFVDATHGWMVGSDGVVLASADGGRSWSPVAAAPRGAAAVDFVDTSNGWVIGADGSLSGTTDGGATWTGLGGSMTSVQFVTAASGWGVARRDGTPVGPVVRTDDGGATWNEAGIEATSVCFVDGQDGWAAGPSDAGASALRTTDGGATWAEVPFGIPGGEQGWTATVRCSAGGAWVLATGQGAAGHTAFVVFRVDGSGAAPVLQEAGTHPMGTDQAIPEAANPQPGPVVAFDGSAAAIVTSCPPCGGDLPSVSFEDTADGGVTWGHATVVGSNPPGTPLGVTFVDADHGWALLSTPGGGGSSTTVLATADSGQTWAEP
jgi:hypothetical protein